MKYIILILCAFLSCSCSNDDLQQENSLHQEVKHDTPPAAFIGEWASVSHKKDVIVTITDTVITLNLTKYNRGVQVINLSEHNTTNISDRLYRIINNGDTITLSSGLGEYSNNLTLTINNDCIARMEVYVPPVLM